MTGIPSSTIFALSSAPGRAGVSVIRVSGSLVRGLLDSMVRRVPPPREAVFRNIRHPRTKEPIDGALVLWFAGPASETGEDVAEFQVHGSPAVVRALLEALGEVDGCRLAEPGEFARRAFDNGRIDLAQAEGLADLVDAETEAQRRQALAQASGALSRLYEGWRTRLIEIAGLVEAAIDFSDEGDVAGAAFDEARARAARLAPEIGRHLNDGHRGEIVRDGFRVALLGPPNAGKSSLLNWLARREAAIVSAEAGTTRDVIEVKLDLGGLPVIISDTAGIRDAEGEVEREGIRRSLKAAQSANLVLWLTERGDDSEVPDTISRETSLVIHSKADVSPESKGIRAISTVTAAGLDWLVSEIGRRAAVATRSQGEGPPVTQARHRRHLNAALLALTAFTEGASEPIELRAEDLRQAASAIGRITGRVDVEDVLGEIFDRFCIGK